MDDGMTVMDGDVHVRRVGEVPEPYDVDRENTKNKQHERPGQGLENTDLAEHNDLLSEHEDIDGGRR